MDKERPGKKEMIFNGIPVSPGIAFGVAFVVNVEDLPVTDDAVRESRVAGEIERFETALRETEAELRKLHERIEDEMGEEHAKILDSHREMLADEMVVKETIRLIKKEKVNAAYAFSKVLDRVLTTFDNIKDQYLKERAED
ncbi:MAG: phosphoenolpyruvate--protein phosphotransferase, partial [Candidatus Krumholzibacteria bacterium]|nr:phosphoenolpyruvate--protein phosphotransferase [Candidatus Krumholzibacteria bacterium]